MGKRELYYEQAEHLYVRGKKTLREISSLLGVSIPTLSAWKKEGSWGTKRRQAMRHAQSLHTTLLEFARRLVELIRDETEREGRVDLKLLAELEKILSHIPRMKQYEEELLQACEGDVRGVLDEKTIEEIHRRVLGM